MVNHRQLNHVSLSVSGAIYGGSDAHERSRGQGLCIAGGYRYLVGTFTNPGASFGVVTLTTSQPNDPSSLDVFLIKVNTAGARQWAVRLGHSIAGIAPVCACDAGAAYVTGFMMGSTATSVCKVVGADGTIAWTVTAAGTRVAIAMDGGHVYTAGRFEGSVTAAGSTLTSAGSKDAIVARHSASTGAESWAVRLGASGDDEATAIAVAGTAVYVASGPAGLTHSPVTYASSDSGVTDGGASGPALLLRLAAGSGAVEWAIAPGPKATATAGAVEAHSLAVTSSGDVFLAGHYSSGSHTLGSASLTGAPSGFVSKFSSTGVARWAKAHALGGTFYSDSTSIVADASGFLHMCGSFVGALTLGGGAPQMTSSGGKDVVIFQMTADDGAVQWALQLGGNEAERCGGVGHDGQGNTMFSGDFTSATAAFGGVINLQNSKQCVVASDCTADAFFLTVDTAYASPSPPPQLPKPSPPPIPPPSPPPPSPPPSQPPLPPKPPPPRLPPPPPPSPDEVSQTSTGSADGDLVLVQVTMTAKGDVSSFTDDKRRAIRAAFAEAANVTIDAVVIDVTSASVRITVTIHLVSSAAEALEATLTERLATPTAASDFLSGAGVNVISTPEVATRLLSPPSAPPLATTGPAFTVGLASGATAAGIVILLGCFLWLRKRRTKAPATPPPRLRQAPTTEEVSV